MKSSLFFLFAIIVSMQSYAQDLIKFDYDVAGNQIVRKLCLNCMQSKFFYSDSTKIDRLGEVELLKFYPKDVISYYPNPVSEQLYLKWDLIDNNKVLSIDIFSVDGKIIHAISDLENKSETILQIEYFTEGVYYVMLNYTNGEKKSITIIKK